MMLGNDFAALSNVLGQDNAQPGPRTVPGRVIPVPTTTSPQFKTLVAAPYRAPDWNADPQTREAWHALVAQLAAKGAAKLPALREKLGVTSEPTTLGGVEAFLVKAKSIPAAHAGKVILAIHGGGFVYNPGEAGTLEAILTRRLRRLRGLCCRLPHGAGPSVSRRQRRRHGRLQGAARDPQAGRHRGGRHLGRRRPDPGAVPARQGRGRAAARPPSRPARRRPT